MAANSKIRILFIGNSHTYYHDMPAIVSAMAKQAGIACDVTMIAHGGWYLKQHTAEPDVRFNIMYGHYDYVVLQEHAHPFGPEELFFEAVQQLNGWIREAGSVPVIYMTWAKKEEEEEQLRMTAAHEKIAEEINAVLAPVGREWWAYKKSHPGLEMYDEDGAHASETGSEFAAKIIWESICADMNRK